MVHTSIQSRKITFVNIYAPNQDDPTFFEKIQNLLQSYPNEEFILLGDFNTHLHPKLDKQGGNANSKPKSRQIIQNLMETLDLVDIWRNLNNEKKTFTHYKFHPRKIFIRIDYILLSGNLSNFVTQTKIIPGFKSDHSAVCVSLDLKICQIGALYWRFPIRLLNHENYLKTILEAIPTIFQESKEAQLSPTMEWDFLKYKLRIFTQHYQHQMKAEIQNKIENMENNIFHYFQQLNKGEEVQQEFKIATLELENFYDILAKEKMESNKLKYYENFEKCNKFFFNLAQPKFVDNTMYNLYLDETTSVNNPQDILKATRNFWKNILTDYSPRTSPMQNKFFDTLQTPITQLTQQQQQKISQNIYWEETESILKDMKKGSAPGMDGFPIEFWQFLLPHLKEKWFNLLTYMFQQNTSPKSFKQGVISLIPKRGKNIKFIENWRPITLLNADYKLIARTWAKRIQEILPSIIQADQRGFVKGRFIGENIMDSITILHELENLSDKAVCIALDLYKAFNTVKWNYMFKVLDHYKFPNIVIKWMKIFYSHVELRTSNGLLLSEVFLPQ